MRYLALLVVLATQISDTVVAADSRDLLQQAIETYQSALDTSDRGQRVQSFSRAESLFASAIQQQWTEDPSHRTSADLYVNLGNAALGAEHLGPAILAYRRALLADPKHRRARQNLQHARGLLPDWVPTPEENIAIGSFFDWTRGLKPADWSGLAAIAFLITMLLAAVYLRTGKATARHLAIVFGIIWIGTLAKPLIDQSKQSQRLAVVIVPDVIARSADSINAPARFPEPLPSGSELYILDDRDDWIRVQLFDSREAWVPASAIDVV